MCVNTGAIDGLRLPKLLVVWECGHSDSVSAVEGCEKLQVQRSEHRHGKHSLWELFYWVKISSVCAELAIPLQKGGGYKRCYVG